jgi:hypothetical protein
LAILQVGEDGGDYQKAYCAEASDPKPRKD